MPWLLFVSLLLMLVGLFGTVLPGIPGMPLVLAGVALYGLGSGLEGLGLPTLLGLLGLGLLGMALSYAGSLFGARRLGASWAAILGALVGLALGLTLLAAVLGPFGIVVGPLLGAVVAELWIGRAPRVALRSGLGVVVGYALGTLAEVVTALIVIGWFLLATIPPLLR